MTEAGLLQLQFIAIADPVLCQIYSAYVTLRMYKYDEKLAESYAFLLLI